MLDLFCLGQVNWDTLNPQIQLCLQSMKDTEKENKRERGKKKKAKANILIGAKNQV